MRKLKYSHQREAIKSFLTENRHPTADEVYMGVRESFPNVSLGTVYRNLNQLSENGEIQKLTFPEGPDHFDYNPEPHYHFICKSCGRVYDLKFRDLRLEPDDTEEELPGRVEDYAIVGYGTCSVCLAREEKKGA